jgi:hypothetical protein
MKTKALLLSLFLVLAASLVSSGTVQAQCSVCKATISTVNDGPILGPRVRVYGVNTGYFAPCNNPTYVWTCTPAAGVAILAFGGQARFTFPAAGVYTICCTFTVQGPGGPCSVTSCKNVVIP